MTYTARCILPFDYSQTYQQLFDISCFICHHGSVTERCRLRLKLSDGAELEAEGNSDFVERQREAFLGPAPQPPAASRSAAGPLAAGQEPRISWEAVAELRGRNLTLRGKLPQPHGEREACLVLLAASHRLLDEPKPTATQLAKWLRRSGYPVKRMDRALQAAVQAGQLLSSGSRRARRYELTASGRLKALILADALSRRAVEA